MENYYYYYKINYCVDGKKEFAEGVTFGATWTEVIRRLTEYYGDEELFEILYMTPINEGGECLELRELNEGLDTIKKEGR